MSSQGSDDLNVIQTPSPKLSKMKVIIEPEGDSDGDLLTDINNFETPRALQTLTQRPHANDEDVEMLNDLEDAGIFENNDKFKPEDAGGLGVADNFEPDSKANSLGWESAYFQAKQKTDRLACANGKKKKRAFRNEVQQARAIANLGNKKAKIML